MTAGVTFAFPDVPQDLLSSLVERAQDQRMGRLALVGGAVRDALLYHYFHNRWLALPDLDFVLEGPCDELVRSLQETLGPKRVTDVFIHEQFGTAKLLMDGVSLDFACARTETYPSPGENPVVQPGLLDDDLARRDFTVNAMALVLQPDGSQLLMDPHGGLEHLAAKHLAFLHECSVADDPTRVIRAARYAARLGFRLTPDALSQLECTMKAWPWAWRQGDPVDAVPPALGTRLRMELELLLEREPWAEALGLLRLWSAMSMLDPGLQIEPG